MSGYHAVIAPSSLARTVACNAWVQLAQGLPPEPDSEETLEGNAADWVAKQYAAGNEVAYGTEIPLPGGFKVDYDMIHGAKMWVDVIGYGSISGVPVVCERIHPTDCWGEPDGWRWDGIDEVLRLPDYKYGFELVEVFENWQLIAYAAGLIDTLGLSDAHVMIEFIIVQPRAFHKDGPVRRWRVRASNLRALINQAHDAAIHAWPPAEYKGATAAPVARTGPHCIHCPARGVCRTFQAAGSTVVQFAGQGERVALDANAVGVELLLVQTALELLKGKESALAAQAEAFLRAGKRVPNYHMEPGQTRREWLDNVTAAEVIALGQLLNPPKDLRKPPGALNSRSSPIITPSQAIKAGVDEAVINQYAARPHGAMKLVRDSTTEARRAFGADRA